MTTDDKRLYDPNDNNPDPITNEPGAHPIGTGLGAASTGAIGTAIGGAFGGPVGAVVGAAVGAVTGGIFGKIAAESVNPTVEDEYWRTNYSTRPYVEAGRHYEDYQPAYQTGYEGYGRYASTGKRYDEVEPELRADYEKRHSGAGLAWERAKHATRDAWDRVENTVTRRHYDSQVDEVPTSETEGVYHERTIVDRYPKTPDQPVVHRDADQDRLAEAERRLQREAQLRREAELEPDRRDVREPIIERSVDEPRNSL